MSALEALKLKCEYQPYKNFGDLEEGRYTIYHFAISKTKRGKCVRIDLGKFYMFLPERFAEVLDEDKIDELNKSPKVMIYKGKDPANQDR